jgi:hypothetical protein
MPRMKEKAELAKRGFESISVKREHPDGRVEVEANKLHPVPVEGETIYAPVPVSFSVALDAGGRVKSIEGGDPSFADAGRYIKTLRDSGQLAVAGDRQAASRPTHQIERDAQGRDVLRRKRFWIS